MTPGNEGDYAVHVGKPVRVDTQNKSYFGFVEATNYEYTKLRPSLVDESLHDGDLRLRLQEDIPTTIHTPNITAVVPLSKGFLETLLNHHNNGHPKIIVPD